MTTPSSTARSLPPPSDDRSIDTGASAQHDDEVTLRTRTAQRLAALLALVATVPLSPSLRARYAAQVTDTDAATMGRQIRTTAVLSDAASIPPSIVMASIGRALPGFGPTQMRYTLELAQRLHERDAERRADKVTYALQHSASAVTRADVMRSYRRLRVCLDTLLVPGDPERAALDAVSLEDQSHDAAVNALESLAQIAEALLGRAAADDTLRLYCEDNGLTRASLAEVLAPAAIGDSPSVEGADDGEVIDVLEGRLADQLKRLRRVVEEARKTDPSLTEVTLPRTSRKRAPKKQNLEGAAKKSRGDKKDPEPAKGTTQPAGNGAPAKPADDR